MANFRNARARNLMARDARRGVHHTAGSITPGDRKYEITNWVRVKKTGDVARVIGIESWGDYLLEGIKGGFPSSLLEPADPPE
jgi:hypothetical protein